VSDKKPVLRDVDSAGRTQNLQAALWSIIGGIIVGGLAGIRFGLLGFVVGWLAGGFFIWLITVLIADRAAAAVGSVYMASGSSTPGPRQYSQGDALAAQGKLPAAVKEYEQNIADYPTDPEPRIRLARLYRDRLQQYEDAAHHFKQVLQLTKLPETTQGAVARELVELLTHRMHAPNRALPILARLAAQQPDSAAGKWAKSELAELKTQMPTEEA
jgi:tetratricopeptide (TPR) repeat protein